MYSSAAEVIDEAKATPNYLGKLLSKLRKSVIANEDYASEKEKLRICKQEAKHREVFNKLFGARYLDEDFGTYKAQTDEQIKALNICKRYAGNLPLVLSQGMGLILRGAVGTGKNHLGYAILKQAIREGFEIAFGELDKIIRKIREPWTTKKGTEQKTIDHYCNVDLLLIEEVGIQGKGDSDKAMLFEIINGRYNRKKATIFITNLSKKELEEYLDFGKKGRIWDRFQGGLMTEVVFEWESYRGTV